MTRTALDILQQTFGYEQFRGQQQAIIDTLSDGNNALVLMPTGGGKSLCYQIPALLRSGTGVVISPLIALMQDQVNALEQLGVRASFLNSSLDREQQLATEQHLRRGELDLLYIAPERLVQPYTLNLLSQIDIALFAIDEAHCVSQWGHDFRADYLNLNILQQHFPQVPRIALTATADERTRAEIITRLELQQAPCFISGFDRANIQYRITQKQNARQQLLRFLRREHEDDSGIVYCLSRKKVEDTARWLSEQGFTALPYHAGLASEIRQRHQARFLREDAVIIVATIAFGMGIDKPDVRFVAHLDLPKSVEAYYQETGRAGRDGDAATAWMVYGLQDVIKLRQMLESSESNDAHKRIERYRLEAMLGLCEITSCRRHALLHYFGESSPLHCGNCDTCLTPVNTWDGTEAARKALSCAYRTGQRFGVNHLIDVLRGETTDKVQQFNHDRLTTFGIGSELDSNQWRSVFRQLVARGYLTVDLAGYGALLLSEKCRPLLRGDETIQLRHDVKETVAKAAKTRKSKHDVAAEDQQLWDALRDCRKRLATELSVPPYVIFHDSTLMAMLEYRPLTEQQMLRISGVGESKLERFGDAFLEVIRNSEQQSQGEAQHQQIEQSVQSLAMANMDVAAIARQCQLSEAEVYSHLVALIQNGELSLDQVLDLSEQQLAEIEDALFAQDSLDSSGFSFKAVRELLSEEYPLGVLRCVRAEILREA